MKTLALSLVFIAVFLEGCDKEPNFIMPIVYGPNTFSEIVASQDGNIVFYDACDDRGGNVVAVGCLSSFDGSSQRSFIAAFDSIGNVISTIALNPSYPAQLNCVTYCEFDNTFYAGGTGTQYQLIAISSFGTVITAQSIPAEGDTVEVRSIIETGGGALIVAGNSKTISSKTFFAIYNQFLSFSGITFYDEVGVNRSMLTAKKIPGGFAMLGTEKVLPNGSAARRWFMATDNALTVKRQKLIAPPSAFYHDFGVIEDSLLVFVGGENKDISSKTRGIVCITDLKGDTILVNYPYDNTEYRAFAAYFDGYKLLENKGCITYFNDLLYFSSGASIGRVALSVSPCVELISNQRSHISGFILSGTAYSNATKSGSSGWCLRVDNNGGVRELKNLYGEH